ncbi:hypothetical protein [Flavobacterium sp.]|uniref:hypothetical protein n=1 Tax=Flavobacterium sp. TaxID=239 RepID=UPI003D6C35C4
MLTFLLLNKKPIQTIFKLLLLFFGVFALLLILFAYALQGVIVIIYPLIFTIVLTIFCVLIITFLEYLRTIKETAFFKKTPYKVIEEKLIAIDFIQNSKYSFFKKHRIFKIDDFKYEAVFYSNVVRNEFGNALVILKEIHTEERCVFHIIDYKKQVFDEFSLINELKKIS